jgi:hypothetical protein
VCEFLPLVRRCSEFMAWSDRELETETSRAIFLHMGDKCQTLDGFWGMRGAMSRLAGIYRGVDVSGVV